MRASFNIGTRGEKPSSVASGTFSHATAREKAEITGANHCGDIARDALAIFPDSPLKDALLEAVDFCVARAY